MKTSEVRERGCVLGSHIDAIAWDSTLERVMAWARRRESRYVTICNVHVVVSAARDASYLGVINASDMATPDGAPVAWMLRRQGYVAQRRISGPDVMWALCERCARDGIPVYFFGGTETTLALLRRRLRDAIPALEVETESPPFRALLPDEDEATIKRIDASGAGVVFVGLGCPKQEIWMAQHRDRVNAVMIGVGAAFDFHAGTVQRAPAWMRGNGLEWLHRLLSEPRRLWKRYLITNSLFVLGATIQLIKMWTGQR